ncbi:sensor histidine kinase [Agromyces sp. NPDC055520]
MHARRLFAVVTVVAGAVSIAATFLIRVSGAGADTRNIDPWLIAEPFVLAALVVVVVRWSSPRAAIISASIAAAGAGLWVQRFLEGVPVVEAAAASVTWLALPLAMGVIAWYLRWAEVERQRTIDNAKAEQRLRLAVDLHDYVAHDISEIVAQAQAGSAVLPLGDPRVAELLDRIEAAGIRALESMDQTVRALGTDEDSVHTIRGGIDDIEELVRRFAAAGEVDALVDQDVDGRVDARIGAEAYRTVVEALTNVRRHAVRVKTVGVELTQLGDQLRVSIADDGDHRSDAVTSTTGGLGLAAMVERVERLGGSAEAGPRRSRGWRVTATLPMLRSTEHGASS